MLPDFDDIQEGRQSQQTFSDRYLERFIEQQEIKLQTRKLIEEMLLTVSCQVASASMAIILFQYAVQVYFALFLCLVVSWIPLFISLAEADLEQTKTSEGYSISIMSKGLRIVIKFVTGVGIVSFTIHSIYQDIRQTQQQINDVYAEIQQYEQPKLYDFLPPYTGLIIMASIAIVAVVMLVKTMRDRNPF